MNGPRTVGPACTLGEGPLWHPGRQQLFWFDIPVGTLYWCKESGADRQSWQFGEPAFGGRELKTLYITSARENLSPEALTREPDAGKVIVLDVDVPGIPEHRLKIR